jgi:GPH family glycoside/pentoside/hexuronide:cation symporter
MSSDSPATAQLGERASTSRSGHLSFWTKLFYGTGDTGFALLNTTLSVYLLFFLVTVVKLPPAYAAVAIFLGRTWDWINDPLMGFISDHTRSRWGRRKPYLLFGPIPFGLCFILLWWVPPFESYAALTAYYALAYFLYDAMATLVWVPYLALIPEMTPDYDERTSMNMYRMFFNILASIMGFAAPELAGLGIFPDLRTGYLVMAACFAVIGAVPLWAVYAVAKERPQSLRQQTADASREGYLLASVLEWVKRHRLILAGAAAYLLLWTGLFYVLPRLSGATTSGASWTDFVFYAGFLIPMAWITIRAFRRNVPFLMCMGIFLLTWTTINVVQAILPFFITYWLGMENRITEIMAMVFVSALIWLPFWNWFAHRFSKRRAYIVGMISLIVVLIVMAFLPRDTPFTTVILLSFLAGVGVSTAHIIPNAIIPDSIEWDELQTGQRREGILYSMITLMNKVASSVAVPWAALVLALSGFSEALGLDQLDSAFTAIRLLVGLAPGVLMIGGIVLAAYYPLTRERHARIRRILAKRLGRQVQAAD